MFAGWAKAHKILHEILMLFNKDLFFAHVRNLAILSILSKYTAKILFDFIFNEVEGVEGVCP